MPVRVVAVEDEVAGEARSGRSSRSCGTRARSRRGARPGAAARAREQRRRRGQRDKADRDAERRTRRRQRRRAARVEQREHGRRRARRSQCCRPPARREEGPCGLDVGRVKAQGSDRGSGAVRRSSPPSVRAAPTRRAVQRHQPRSGLRLGGSHAQPPRRAFPRTRKFDGDRECEPGDRILEEAAVEERVHEQREQHRGERQPERGVAPVHLERPASPRRRAERGRREPDHAELGRDRQRRRVRDEIRLGREAVGGAWLASGCAPMPTPASGCCANTRAVSSTRRERSLVALRRQVSSLVDDEGGRPRSRARPRSPPRFGTPAAAADRAVASRRRQRARRGSTASTRSTDHQNKPISATAGSRRCTTEPERDDDHDDPEHDVPAVEARDRGTAR